MPRSYLLLACLACSRGLAPQEAAVPPAGDLPACLRTIAAADLSLLASAAPGDCLVLADGAHGDLTITAKGTAAAPIQVRAQSLGRAVAGAVRLSRGAHLVLHGLAMATLLIDNCDHCRVTRCQIKGGPGPAWIRIDEQKGCRSGCTDGPAGTSKGTRLDHCDIGPGTSDGDILNPTALSTGARIDHNHFHDVSGRHVITVGCCGPTYDYHDSGHVIEHNLFTNVRGGELVSIKSSGTTFRYNTVRRSGGDVNIRAGRRDAIHDNYLFGPGGGGIRMYEDDHRIYNNYVETAKALQMGPANAGHAEVKNATVVFNTFVGGVSVSGTGNVIAGNVVVGGSLGEGNLGGSAEELGLVRAGELLVPSPAGKVASTAAASFPFVTGDVTGRRRERAEMGAILSAPTPPLRRPLTPADVGPAAP
jgi:hypothetical protein